jgi:hypothetical protein
MLLLSLGFWTKLFLAITQQIYKSQLYAFLKYLAAWLDAGGQITVKRIAVTPGVSSLAALNTSLLSNGVRVWVESVRGVFTLQEQTVSPVTNGRTIVAANGSVNHVWYWDGVCDPSWTLEPTWWVDNVSGNDENAGNTQLAAVATFDEIFLRRIGRGATVGPSPIDVRVARCDPNGTLNFHLNTIAPATPRATLNVLGTETILHAGSFTAGTADTNRATPSETVVHDAAIGDFAPYVGVDAFIEITASATPAKVGACAAILARLTATSVATSSFAVPDDSGMGNTVVRFAPASGDDYKIVTYPHTRFGTLRATISSMAALNPGYNLNRMSFVDASDYAQLVADDAICNAERCSFNSAMFNGPGGGSIQSCLLRSLCGCGGQYWLFSACGVLNQFDAYQCELCTFTDDSVFYGGNGLIVHSMSHVQMNNTGFFASVSNGITVDAGGVAQNSGGAVYGTANAAFGIVCHSGGVFVYANKPEINKTLGIGRETKVGGTDKQYAAIPFVEPANNAMIVANV